MLRGIYQAAAGMKARLAVQDIIANNLANAGTAGFQREVASIQARMLPVADAIGAPPSASGLPSGPREAFLFLRPSSAPDTREGVLQRTGVDTDVALDGPGYLLTQTARGARLTRGGPLRVN